MIDVNENQMPHLWRQTCHVYIQRNEAGILQIYVYNYKKAFKRHYGLSSLPTYAAAMECYLNR